MYNAHFLPFVGSIVAKDDSSYRYLVFTQFIFKTITLNGKKYNLIIG
jgi:ubiquinone/menaquinone biosynthesis C-methylase UbiE